MSPYFLLVLTFCPESEFEGILLDNASVTEFIHSETAMQNNFPTTINLLGTSEDMTLDVRVRITERHFIEMIS